MESPNGLMIHALVIRVTIGIIKKCKLKTSTIQHGFNNRLTSTKHKGQFFVLNSVCKVEARHDAPRR